MWVATRDPWSGRGSWKTTSSTASTTTLHLSHQTETRHELRSAGTRDTGGIVSSCGTLRFTLLNAQDSVRLPTSQAPSSEEGCFRPHGTSPVEDRRSTGRWDGGGGGTERQSKGRRGRLSRRPLSVKLAFFSFRLRHPL